MAYPANKSTSPLSYNQNMPSIPSGVVHTNLTWRQDGRLANEQTTGGPNRSYAADAAGQLLCRGQSPSACPGSVANTCTGGAAGLYLYQYDPRGNRLCQLANGAVTSYSYSADNTARLTSTATGATTTTYTYDADGRRTGASSGVTNITYDARGLATAVTSPSGVENRARHPRRRCWRRLLGGGSCRRRSGHCGGSRRARGGRVPVLAEASVAE